MQQLLAVTDDGSSSAIDITAVFRWFKSTGAVYRQIYINNKCNVTYFSAFAIAVEYWGYSSPTIAPFWVDAGYAMVVRRP